MELNVQSSFWFSKHYNNNYHIPCQKGLNHMSTHWQKIEASNVKEILEPEGVKLFRHLLMQQMLWFVLYLVRTRRGSISLDPSGFHKVVAFHQFIPLWWAGKPMSMLKMLHVNYCLSIIFSQSSLGIGYSRNISHRQNFNIITLTPANSLPLNGMAIDICMPKLFFLYLSLFLLFLNGLGYSQLTVLAE